MKRLCWMGGVVLLLTLAAGRIGFAAAEDIHTRELRILGQDYVPGEIVVKFKDAVDPAVIDQLNSRHRASEVYRSLRGRFRRLKIANRMTVEQMIEIYKDDPSVEYVEANCIRYAFEVPNDPYYIFQWNLDNAVYGGIGMEQAWDITAGDPNVIIAVIDTGVAYEDYKRSRRRRDPQYYRAPDFENTVFVPGHDFVNRDDHPNDDEGHGTHVAGILAQSTNNASGAAGIAHKCSIMPIKVLDEQGMGTDADVADGIMFAADNGAHVINMSLGGPGISRTLENACRYAHEKGIVIVCAAGNSGASPIQYPAGFDNYCIAVGAVRYDFQRTYYSSYGQSLDLVAPGGDNTVDQNGDGYNDSIVQQTFYGSYDNWGYHGYIGTSMAAPHVSAVAALLIANGNATTTAEVRAALEETARDVGPAGWDVEYGWGVVDAPVALSWTCDGTLDTQSPAIESVTGDTVGTTGESVRIEATVTDDLGVANVVVRYVPVAGIEMSLPMAAGAANTWTANLTAASDEVGIITYYILARDRSGKTSREPENSAYQIQVYDNDPPVVVAGETIEVQTGVAAAFDGAASTDNIAITSYSWDFDPSDGIGVDSTQVSTSHTYDSPGTYTATLTVDDAAGNGPVSGAVQVIVTDEPPEKLVFYDSFESSGAEWYRWLSRWNGLWVEDRQRDWFRSSIRSTDGLHSAEVIGRARDATLTSTEINLLGRTTAVVSFDWYIEKTLDRREYLAFDVNTGNGWVEMESLDGNRWRPNRRNRRHPIVEDKEGLWHSERFVLTDISELRIRFRGRMTSWREGADVDNVMVVAR